MNEFPTFPRSVNVVCIGGGTGLSTLLRGIRQHATEHANDAHTFDLDRLTAIVAVSDDGGSSGRLIDECGVLPPGDIRNCLTALAEQNQVLSNLFEYRFITNGSLSGHSIGNLLLVALSKMYGSFPRAIQEASKVLAVKGCILPVTLDAIALCAELEDGTCVEGESDIPNRQNSSPIRRVFLRRRGDNGDAEQPIQALDEAIVAIHNADVILLGPGSLFTSILPNLAVPGIPEALEQSRAVKIYLCNVMTEPGETDGFTVTDHVTAIQRQAGCIIDYVLTNSRPASSELIHRYQKATQEHHFKTTGGKKNGNGNGTVETHNRVPLRRKPTAHPLGVPDVQVLYNPETDQIPADRIWQEDLLAEEMIRENRATVRVLRHDPVKSATAVLRLLQHHFRSVAMETSLPAPMSAPVPPRPLHAPMASAGRV